MDRGFYRIAGLKFKSLIEKKGTLKNLVLSSNIRKKSSLFALLSEAFKYRTWLEEIFKCSLLERELSLVPRKHPDFLCKEEAILVLYEYLWSPELNGPSEKCKKTMKVFLTSFQFIAKNKTRISAEWTRIKIKKNILSKEELLSSNLYGEVMDMIPRYARINRVLPDAETRVTLILTAEGFQIHPKTDTRSEKLVFEKGCKSVYYDAHINDLLLFPPKTPLYKHNLVKEGYLILQDKASCFPAFILAPPSNGYVLDACSAPGNKTTHLASFLNAAGTLVAVEKDRNRFKLLESMCTKAHIKEKKNITLVNADFLALDYTQEPYSKIEYILLDPSCSGSGMLARVDNDFQEDTLTESSSENTTETSREASSDRLKRLSNFQVTALSHALKFPNLKELVYSTCSIHKEENELVIAEILIKFSGKFKLSSGVLPLWTRRGIPIEGGARLTDEQAACLVRANPLEDLCNGFFVAKFEKIK